MNDNTEKDSDVGINATNLPKHLLVPTVALNETEQSQVESPMEVSTSKRVVVNRSSQLDTGVAPTDTSFEHKVRQMEGVGEVPANTTEEFLQTLIISQTFHRMGKKTMICLTTLSSGFEIITSSACVDPDDFHSEIGSKLCTKKAIDKIWELEGYLEQVNPRKSE